MGLSEHQQAAVAAFICSMAQARGARISSCARLGGGAIQDNFALEIDIEGGERAGTHTLVLRSDASSKLAASLDRAQEFAVLQAAKDAGVTVPEPLWLCEDPGLIGRPFYLMERVPGSALPRNLTRDGLSDHERRALVERLGAELAHIHRITPPRSDLAFLEPPADDAPARARIAHYRASLDDLAEPHATLEYGLHWLERHAPSDEMVVLCHGDFRTGNYLVDSGTLTGILDWEFAAWSDPHEDLGWFCARCWRFGAWHRQAGGVGPLDALLGGYEGISGRKVSRSQVRYWEVMAAVRWAIIALQQAQRHISGEQPSLELALTGRMVAEMELEILEQTLRLDNAGREDG